MLDFQVPNLSEIKREFELYNYLKDGTELCRMIGLLTKGSIPEGVIYSPNNIFALEEKNISLFIRVVEEELKLPKVFGVHGSKVLHQFSTFYVVLSGLARVSTKIHKILKIPKFVNSGKMTEVGYENTDFADNLIQGYKEEGEFSIGVCKSASFVIEKEQGMQQRPLDAAVARLINHNERFTKEVLVESRW